MRCIERSHIIELSPTVMGQKSVHQPLSLWGLFSHSNRNNLERVDECPTEDTRRRAIFYGAGVEFRSFCWRRKSICSYRFMCRCIR
mmetsp:Transcript_423/g.811  ORF Transcript_423/g.811 Transcript_423/m.811 type:complete len:86 (-) Transcript_423:375-632(-)